MKYVQLTLFLTVNDNIYKIKFKSIREKLLNWIRPNRVYKNAWEFVLFDPLYDQRRKKEHVLNITIFLLRLDDNCKFKIINIFQGNTYIIVL